MAGLEDLGGHVAGGVVDEETVGGGAEGEYGGAGAGGEGGEEGVGGEGPDAEELGEEGLGGGWEGWGRWHWRMLLLLLMFGGGLAEPELGVTLIWHAFC